MNTSKLEMNQVNVLPAIEASMAKYKQDSRGSGRPQPGSLVQCR
jgi:hypothetical protein